MNLPEYLHSELTRLHREYERALRDLSIDQWHWIPEGKGNSIAFITWHMFRTEDNVIRFVVQNRRPTVWVENGWAEKFGMHKAAQGTGMPVPEAQLLRVNDPAAFLEYGRQVWASTSEYLTTAKEDDYNEMIEVRPLGQMPKIRAVGQVCLSHGFGHLGEMDHLRVLMGLPGIGI